MRGKSALTLAAGIAALLAATLGARAADNWPSRPIHIIVPYPSGGIVDIVARAVTEQVGRDTKQAIVVEGGEPAPTAISAPLAVARSEGDGYTWLVTGPAVLVNPTLYKDAGWDPLKDFKCVGLAVWNQSVALVRSLDAGEDRLPNSSSLRKAKPGQLNFGNPVSDVDRPLRTKAVSVPPTSSWTNVGYKGQPQALIDLMTNLMHFEIVSLALALPHIKEGTVKPLAVFTDKRVPDLPDVPTIAEAGYYGNVDGFDFWNNSDAIKPEQRLKMGTIHHQKIISTKSGKDSGELVVQSVWTNGAGEDVIQQTTRYVFSRRKGINGIRGLVNGGDVSDSRVIDQIVTLHALKKIVFHDDKEGLLGIRVAHFLESANEKGGTFTDANGNPTQVSANNVPERMAFI